MAHLVYLDQEVNEFVSNLHRTQANVTLDHLSVPGGRHFVMPYREGDLSLRSVDYSGVRILHHGLDTIRQLFEGLPDLRLEELFEKLIADNEFHMPRLKIEEGFLAGEWILRRSGKGSGYRYMLQNDLVGVQLFFLSRFQKYKHEIEDVNAGINTVEPVYGSHLKIQTQSMFNNHHTDEQFRNFYEGAASYFFMGMQKWRYKAVSVHMACDVQGWSPTLDMLSDFVTASNKRDINLGVETIDIDTHGVVHGKQFETVTLGNVRFSEFTIYDKLLKADKVGACTYWETIYRNNCSDYDNQQQVRRVEVRFSHNVILQMSDFLVKQFFDALPADFSPSEAFVMQANDETGLRSYFQLKPYLNALWQSGLGKTFRYLYDYANDKKTLHPIWTILLNEVDWGGDRYVDLKRLYKKPISERDPEQTEKFNVKMALANIVSLTSRHFMDMLDDPYNLIDNTDLGLTQFVEDFIDSLQHIARGGFMIAVEKVFSYGFRGYNYWRDRLIDYLQEAFRRRLLCRGSA